MKGREILIYLSLKYEGDWEKIYHAIKTREKFDFDQARIKIDEIKSKVLTCVDEDYPVALKSCFHPPFVLYYYGDLSLIKDEVKKPLGIIGSRDASEYGQDSAKEFAKDLSKDFIIVSGLARGIDTLALDSAIKEGGKVVAVLGSGIDNCYPKENEPTYRLIKKDHLLLSEYPTRTKPHDYHFPMRNRLIAALSDGVLVIEGKERSGTLITVGHALTLGKDIFCIPHRRQDSPTTNMLIKDGATLVLSGSDIYEYYGIEIPESK